MSVEGGNGNEKKKNPWSIGAENDAKLRAEDANKRPEIQRAPEDRTRFFETLRDSGGTLEETYSLTALGSIGRAISRRFTGGSEKANAPVSLLSFAALGRENKWTPDSAREAAVWINDLFPEVEFTFFEDRNANTFMYRARISSSGVQE